MILENKTENVVLEDGVSQGSTTMSIDTESTAFIMQMLSKFYSDAIGSLIRETASNALDSHREANIKEPIIVSLTKSSSGNYEFSVKDVGVGLDTTDVENVIKKYGKSTKRQSINQLGAFGLGMKSPLAYTSSFYFIGRKNGVERKWMMYEAEEEANKIELLYESETTERNGVEVIVPIKWNDRYDFIQKIKEQLCYFEYVYFNVENIDNSFKIIREKDFQWSKLNIDNEMHITLDDVYYSIDWNKLGISSINFPIALRFSLTDGIFPVPNREQIKMTKEAKEIILAKIKLVSEYFVNKYNTSISDSDDIKAIFAYHSNSRRTVPGFDTGVNWDIAPLTNYSSVKLKTPKLNNVKLLDLKRIYQVRDYLLKEYVIEQSLRNGRLSTYKYDQLLQTHYLENSGKVLLHEEDFRGLKKEYIKSLYSSFYLIKKKNTIPLKSKISYNYDSWYNILELKNYEKELWREMIKEAKYIISLMMKDVVNIDTLVIDPKWIAERKQKKSDALKAAKLAAKQNKLKGDIHGKVAVDLDRRVYGSSCKLVNKIINLETAHQSSLFTIFGSQNDEKHVEFVKKWYDLVPGTVRLVLFTDRELKGLKDLKLHNWMKIEDFEKGEHKVFKRAVTAYLVMKLIGEYELVFNRSALLKPISEDLYNKMATLSTYKQTYYMGGNQELYDSLVLLAQEKNLFDPITYSLYKEVKVILSKLPFLKNLFSLFDYKTKEEQAIPIIKDLFKFYKQKMDWKNYVLQLNKEVEAEEETEPEPEALTEEKIEEILN